MKTTEHIINVITYLATDFGPHGITEICHKLNLSKATVHRILAGLETTKWVSYDEETRKYKLSTTALQIAFSLISKNDVRTVSLPYLYNLCDTTNETVMLSLRVGFERVYIEQIHGKHELRHVVELQKRYPLWLGAAGKAILAFMDQEEIESVLNGISKSGLEAYASGEAVNIASIRKELEQISKSGFALSSGERVSGTMAIASPIFGHNNIIVGSLSVAGPIPRFNTELAYRYSEQMKNATRAISNQIGAKI